MILGPRIPDPNPEQSNLLPLHGDKGNVGFGLLESWDERLLGKDVVEMDWDCEEGERERQR